MQTENSVATELVESWWWTHEDNIAIQLNPMLHIEDGYNVVKAFLNRRFHLDDVTEDQIGGAHDFDCLLLVVLTTAQRNRAKYVDSKRISKS
jgi:hypothetical protein